MSACQRGRSDGAGVIVRGHHSPATNHANAAGAVPSALADAGATTSSSVDGGQRAALLTVRSCHPPLNKACRSSRTGAVRPIAPTNRQASRTAVPVHSGVAVRHGSEVARAAAPGGRPPGAAVVSRRVTWRCLRCRRRRCRSRAGPGCRGLCRTASWSAGSACEAASCTSRSGTPASKAAVMNACLSVWGVMALSIPARRAVCGRSARRRAGTAGARPRP